MNQNFRVLAGIAATAAIAAFGLATSKAHAAEGDPGWDCATNGNLVCGTPAERLAVQRLASRPALVLPGRWSAPAGPALVQECFESYPNTLADKGVPNAELMGCLAQPDPRKSDPRVMTVAHYQHLQHLHHLHVLHLKHIGR